MNNNQFLFQFSKATAQQQYSGTLPPSDCINGYPAPLSNGSLVSSVELLYSAWCSYQNTLTAKFTYNQATIGAPTTQPTTGPANIFIIRHGEKNASGTHYCLNANGIYRACNLANFVNQLGQRGFPISYIVTCNPCPYNTSDPSMRPQQTISLTSVMLNMPMFIYGGAQDYEAIVSNLFTSGIFDGLNVIIAWEHSAIQGLVLNLLNAAAPLHRLPANVVSLDPLLYGDEYFNQYSRADNLCPDGNYLSREGVANYSSHYDPSPQGDGSPKYIGTHSYLYPYWNDDCFNKVYCLSSSPATNYVFKFSIFKQDIVTCYASCDLQIGLYQPLETSCNGSHEYYDSSNDVEKQCQLPIDWII